MVIWRIVYRPTDGQKWMSRGNKIYFTKGTATGVMKQQTGCSKESWDEKEKHWVHPSGRLVYRIQRAEIEWEDYESA